MCTENKRRVFLHITQNPQIINFPQTTTNKVFNCKLVHFIINNAEANKYYQIDFGDAGFTEDNITFGAKTGCVHAIPNTPSRLDVPIKFRNNDLPASFILSVYKPGVYAALAVLDGTGCQLEIEYDIKQ